LQATSRADRAAPLPWLLQVAARFNGLTAYKCGAKGAVATQVGLVQFANFSLADNGAGPNIYSTAGKDQGAGVEFSWVMDGRSRVATAAADMAGGRRHACTVAVQHCGRAALWLCSTAAVQHCDCAACSTSRRCLLISVVGVEIVGDSV
jgi:hypothetical protein